MKKPINKIAFLMWVAAAAVALVNIMQVYNAIQAYQFMQKAPGETLFVFRGFFAAISGTITPVVMLVGFGTLIELVDQIRWNTRAKE